MADSTTSSFTNQLSTSPRNMSLKEQRIQQIQHSKNANVNKNNPNNMTELTMDSSNHNKAQLMLTQGSFGAISNLTPTRNLKSLKRDRSAQRPRSSLLSTPNLEGRCSFMGRIFNCDRKDASNDGHSQEGDGLKMNRITSQIREQHEKIQLLQSRINALQRQSSKSVTRVDKLEKAKTAVISNKVNRDEVKIKRREVEVQKIVEVEVKKVKVVQQKKVEEEKVKKVKEEIFKKRIQEVEKLKQQELQRRIKIENPEGQFVIAIEANRIKAMQAKREKQIIVQQKKSMEREFLNHIKHQSFLEKEQKLEELRKVEEQVKELEVIEQQYIHRLQQTIAWEQRQTEQFKEEVGRHLTNHGDSSKFISPTSSKRKSTFNTPKPLNSQMNSSYKPSIDPASSNSALKHAVKEISISITPRVRQEAKRQTDERNPSFGNLSVNFSSPSPQTGKGPFSIAHKTQTTPIDHQTIPVDAKRFTFSNNSQAATGQQKLQESRSQQAFFETTSIQSHKPFNLDLNQAHSKIDLLQQTLAAFTSTQNTKQVAGRLKTPINFKSNPSKTPKLAPKQVEEPAKALINLHQIINHTTPSKVQKKGSGDVSPSAASRIVRENPRQIKIGNLKYDC